MEEIAQAEPMRFSDLMTPDNLYLFSPAAAAIDFASYPDSHATSSSESEGDAGAGTSSKKRRKSGSPGGSSSPTSSLGAVLFSTAGKRLMDSLSEVEKERDELRLENSRLRFANTFLRDEVVELRRKFERM